MYLKFCIIIRMKKNLYFSILIILIILYSLFNEKIEKFTQRILPTNQLPKYIWMYWENKPGKTRPAYLDLCFKTVQKHCSRDFEIILLNEKTVERYIPNLRQDLNKKLNIPQKTDYYRYCLLYLYGGIWLDFDTIVFKSLKPLLKYLKRYDYVGAGCHFNNCSKTGYPKPANWLMISRPNTNFIRSCITECDKVLDNYNSELDYFKLGRTTMWNKIRYNVMMNGWKYYHIPSNCLERDSKYNKIKNNRLISNEDIDKNCLEKSILLPIYNTSPGFPDWFRKLNSNEILKRNLLISKYFRKSLFNTI